LRPPVLQGLLRILGQFNIKIKIKIEIEISGVIILRESQRVPCSVAGNPDFLQGFAVMCKMGTWSDQSCTNGSSRLEQSTWLILSLTWQGRPTSVAL